MLILINLISFDKRKSDYERSNDLPYANSNKKIKCQLFSSLSFGFTVMKGKVEYSFEELAIVNNNTVRNVKGKY